MMRKAVEPEPTISIVGGDVNESVSNMPNTMEGPVPPSCARCTSPGRPRDAMRGTVAQLARRSDGCNAGARKSCDASRRTVKGLVSQSDACGKAEGTPLDDTARIIETPAPMCDALDKDVRDTKETEQKTEPRPLPKGSDHRALSSAPTSTLASSVPRAAATDVHPSPGAVCRSSPPLPRNVATSLSRATIGCPHPSGYLTRIPSVARHAHDQPTMTAPKVGHLGCPPKPSPCLGAMDAWPAHPRRRSLVKIGALQR